MSLKIPAYHLIIWCNIQSSFLSFHTCCQTQVVQRIYINKRKQDFYWFDFDKHRSIKPCDPGTRGAYGLDDDNESESGIFFFPSTLSLSLLCVIIWSSISSLFFACLTHFFSLVPALSLSLSLSYSRPPKKKKKARTGKRQEFPLILYNIAHICCAAGENKNNEWFSSISNIHLIISCLYYFVFLLFYLKLIRFFFLFFFISSSRS